MARRWRPTSASNSGKAGSRAGPTSTSPRKIIIDGVAWARGLRRRRPADMLSAGFATRLHARMFGDVWKWAGTYRTTARNIGIEAYRIGTEVAQLMDDVRYWFANNTYAADEIAVRFHHRLVAIHPFPNGNGRHSRLMADLLIERLGGAVFSWRGGSLTGTGELRGGTSRRCALPTITTSGRSMRLRSRSRGEQRRVSGNTAGSARSLETGGNCQRKAASSAGTCGPEAVIRFAPSRRRRELLGAVAHHEPGSWRSLQTVDDDLCEGEDLPQGCVGHRVPDTLAARELRDDKMGWADPIGARDGFQSVADAYSGCSPRRGSPCR